MTSKANMQVVVDLKVFYAIKLLEWLDGKNLDSCVLEAQSIDALDKFLAGRGMLVAADHVRAGRFEKALMEVRSRV